MKPRRILLVDDEIGLREAIGDSMRMRGYLVDEAGNAADALQLADRADYDVLVTDIRLGSDNGLTLGRRVRDAQREIALIFITGYGTDQMAESAALLGAQGFIRKPFRVSALIDTVERAVPAPSSDSAREEMPNGDSAGEEARTGGVRDCKSVDPGRREEWELRELLWGTPDPADSASGDTERMR